MDPLLDAAIDRVYECAMAPSQWPLTLQKVADCFGDVGCILLYSRDDGSYGVIQSPSLDMLVPIYMDGGWNTRDTRAIRTRERGYFFGRDVITDRDVLTDDEIQTDPFYTEFLARFGLKYFAASMVSPDTHTEVALSVQRASGKPAYTDDELSRLAIIGKHVERALRLSIRLLDEGLAKNGLADALTRMDAGVFILDALGRVKFSNAAAEKFVGNGVDIGNDAKLRFALPHDAAAKTGRGSPLELLPHHQRPIQIPRQGSSRPLMAYLLPVPQSANPAYDFLSHARAIVLLIDPAGAPPDPALRSARADAGGIEGRSLGRLRRRAAGCGREARRRRGHGPQGAEKRVRENRGVAPERTRLADGAAGAQESRLGRFVFYGHIHPVMAGVRPSHPRLVSLKLARRGCPA